MAQETLEQALAKIAADNDLTTVSVGRMPLSDGRIIFTATVHWEGFARSGNPCESGNSEQSIRHAMDDALHLAAADRSPQHTVPCELPTLDVAA